MSVKSVRCKNYKRCTRLLHSVISAHIIVIIGVKKLFFNGDMQ